MDAVITPCTCRTCGQEKPQAEFYWNAAKGRYSTKCKDCAKRSSSAWRKARIDAGDDIDRKYNTPSRYKKAMAAGKPPAAWSVFALHDAHVRRQLAFVGGDVVTCLHCRKAKPIDQFHKDGSKSNGRRSTCKDCDLDRRRAARRTHYQRHAEKVKAKVRQYADENADRITAARHATRSAEKEQLHDNYIVRLLTRSHRIPTRHIPDSLIALTREHVRLKRALNQQPGEDHEDSDPTEE
jgi:hypothetical protein